VKILFLHGWRSVRNLKSNALILHSRADDVIPFQDSEELLVNSGLPSESLIEVGHDHRPNGLEPLDREFDRLADERAGFERSSATLVWLLNLRRDRNVDQQPSAGLR